MSEQLPRDNLIRAISLRPELRSESEGIGTLAGHFAVFDQWARIDSIFEGTFMERLAPGAFAETFAADRDHMKVTFQHGQDPQAGDKPLGPIRSLEEDETGARYEVPLLDTSYNRDLLPGLKAGLYGASFRFQVVEDDFVKAPEKSDHNPDGLPERTITRARVHEFGPVTFPAYSGATASVRSLTDAFRPSPAAAPAAQSRYPGDAPMTYTITDLEATRTVEEVIAFKAQLKGRGQELETEWTGRSFDDPARDEFKSLRDLRKAADAREAEFRDRRLEVEEFAKDESRVERPADLSRVSRTASRIPEDLFDLSEYRARTSSEEAMKDLMRDGARKVAEQVVYPHDRATPERSVAHIHKLLERIDDPDKFARHILATGSPAYIRAFPKAVMGRPLSADEQRAIATVGTTTTGGFAVPFQLDASIILTSDGSVNPLRAISRVEQITGNTWKGVTSAGITVTRGAEAGAITESSPSLGQPEVTVQSVKAEIDFSIESDEDWPRLQAEMARLLQDAKDNEEADSFINGVGTTVYPAGVVQTLDPSSHVGTTGDGFDLDDIGVLTNRLPDRFEPRARFLAHRAVFTEAERLDRSTGGGSVYRPLVAGEPQALLGYPRHNASEMESDFTTSTNPILLFGDFSHFLIADKIGMTVELDPHVRDGNGKWTGQRALLAHWRNSSLILADNAFRLLLVGVVTS